LNGRYVATVLNRAVTLSIVEGFSCARARFAHSLCCGTDATILPREFAVPADHVDRRYTQGVRSPFFSGGV
jgi:hypothetical protein